MNKKILLILILVLDAFAGYEVAESGISFFLSAPEAEGVFIAGDFNDWSETANPMRQTENGWRTEIAIPPGEYEYKFIVDGKYINDPDNPEKVADPYGGYNSILIVSVKRGEDIQMAQTPDHGDEKSTGVVLEYYNPSARNVYLAGSFNDWSPDATPMESDGDGNWSVTLDLEPGKYQYKFVVDGSWQPDPDNPVTESDGYGGINSVIEIDDDGTYIESEVKKVERTSNTFANSRVYIGGKYTGIAESRWNREGDRRFRLDKPRHRLESYLRVRIAENVTAWGSMNLDTRDAERIYETPLSLDSAAIELKTGTFFTQVYYNRPIGGLDDPLDIISGSRLAGTDMEIPFGLGTAGIIAKGELFGASLTGIYCDRYNSSAIEPSVGNLIDNLGRFEFSPFREEIINVAPAPDAYTEYGTDILGARVSRPVGPLIGGGSLRFDSGTWWYALTDLDIDVLDDWIDSTGSESDWFALGNSEWLYGGDIAFGSELLNLWVEYLGYSYSGGVVAGNKENDAGDNNGPIDLDLGKIAGHMGGGGLSLDPVKNLSFSIGYSSILLEAPTDSGLYLRPVPSIDGDGRIDMDYIPIDSDIGNSWRESYFARAEIENPISLWSQGGMEKSRGFIFGGYREATTFGLGAKGSVIWNFIGYELSSKWAYAKSPLKDITERESLSGISLRLRLTDNWYFSANTAYHTCYYSLQDSVLCDDRSLPVFVSVQYKPVDNVCMEIYWGVHPEMANGWPAGRREFVERYMRDNDANFAQGWEALEDIRQIGLRGEIDF